MKLEFEVVLNVDFGGFRLDQEMIAWLIENRGWKVISEEEAEKEWPINAFALMYGSHCVKDQHSFEFRSHKDLVDCVKALQEKYKDDDWNQRRLRNIHDLKVVSARIEPSIEDYHDGKERICWN